VLGTALYKRFGSFACNILFKTSFASTLPGLQEMSPDDERVQIDDRDQILRIHKAVVTDTASYKCITRNIAGEDSKDFDLSVYGKILFAV